MEELHFSLWSGKRQAWRKNSTMFGHPNSCPVHTLLLLLTSHANSYDQTSQMLLTRWMYSQQFLHVQWPSVWDFRRLGSWWGCQASRNPRLRVKFCFFHLDRIFGWKKKVHLWSSSNKRVSRTKKHLQEKKVFAGRDKTTLRLDWSVFNGDWK